jgi:transposase
VTGHASEHGYFPPADEAVMWTDYDAAISQSVPALLALEKRLRGQPVADRVKLLRWLKAQSVRSVRAAAPVLGYCERQLQRWWATYRASGLEALLLWQPAPGRRARVSPEAWTGVEGEMRAGRIARLKDVQHYLQEQWGIDYRSLNGVSQLLKRHKTKLKTGRRRHRQANLAAQIAFKKYLRPQTRPAASRARVGNG